MKNRVIYYQDELNDDFAGTEKIKSVQTPDDFNYINHSIFYQLIEFVIYNIIVRPLVYLYIKIKYLQKFKNRKILRKYKKQGYFVYINHTNGDADAFIPSMLTFPKKAYIIVNPDAISIKGIRTLVMMLGALPVPSTIKSSRNFIDAISKLIKKNKAIIIYPEAHIWPYYTDIRNFKDVSFRYPYDLDVPIFTVTNIYNKRKIFKRPRIVSYVDGPFMVNKELPKKEAIRDLRNQAYNSMKRTVDSNPKYEYVKYIKKEES